MTTLQRLIRMSHLQRHNQTTLAHLVECYGVVMRPRDLAALKDYLIECRGERNAVLGPGSLGTKQRRRTA